MINALIYGIGGKMGANVMSAITETHGIAVKAPSTHPLAKCRKRLTW